MFGIDLLSAVLGFVLCALVSVRWPTISSPLRNIERGRCAAQGSQMHSATRKASSPWCLHQASNPASSLPNPGNAATCRPVADRQPAPVGGTTA